MHTVTIKKIKLLEKIRINRDNHHKGFLEATKAYRLEAIEVLDQALEDARAGRRIITSTSLVQPVDMTKEYDQIIMMLKMSVDEEIELSNTEFQNYVMDDWSWSGAVGASNSAYTAKWSR